MCDECWLDVAMDYQQHKFKQAKLAVEAGQPVTHPHQRKRSSGLKSNPGNGITRQPGHTSSRFTWNARGMRVDKGLPARVRVPFKRPLLPQTKYAINEVLRPGTNSVCLACSHIFYGAAMAQCTRCGGAIHLASDPELQALARYSVKCMEEDVHES